jgi:hypothetical protein
MRGEKEEAGGLGPSGAADSRDLCASEELAVEVGAVKVNWAYGIRSWNRRSHTIGPMASSVICGRRAMRVWAACIDWMGRRGEGGEDGGSRECACAWKRGLPMRGVSAGTR